MKAATLLLCSLAVAASAGQAEEPTGLTDLYGRLREAELEYAGRIGDKELSVDRFEFTFEEGELYLLEPVAGGATRQESVRLGLESLEADAPANVQRC